MAPQVMLFQLCCQVVVGEGFTAMPKPTCVRLLHRRSIRSAAADLDGVVCHNYTGLSAIGRTALHGLSGLELDRQLSKAILARHRNIAPLLRPNRLVPGQIAFVTIGHTRMRRNNGAVAVIEYRIGARTLRR